MRCALSSASLVLLSLFLVGQFFAANAHAAKIMHSFHSMRVVLGPNSPRTPDGKPHARFSVRGFTAGDRVTVKTDNEFVDDNAPNLEPQHFEIRSEIGHGTITRERGEHQGTFSQNAEFIFSIVLLKPESAGEVTVRVDAHMQDYVPPLLERYRFIGKFDRDTAPIDVPLKLTTTRHPVELTQRSNGNAYLLEFSRRPGADFAPLPWRSRSILDDDPVMYRFSPRVTGDYTLRIKNGGAGTWYEIDVGVPIEMATFDRDF